ncbi:MAG: hypothetical protein EB015_01815 [Methylocystaceae bacterium]|nr:hypothetical protein [Methylocystaceae bacterium]
MVDMSVLFGISVPFASPSSVMAGGQEYLNSAPFGHESAQKKGRRSDLLQRNASRNASIRRLQRRPSHAQGDGAASGCAQLVSSRFSRRE